MMPRERSTSKLVFIAQAKRVVVDGNRQMYGRTDVHCVHNRDGIDTETTRYPRLVRCTIRTISRRPGCMIQKTRSDITKLWNGAVVTGKIVIDQPIIAVAGDVPVAQGGRPIGASFHKPDRHSVP